MSQTIVFIHGMFQNDRSWVPWVQYFEALDYQCLAPAWPLHEGEPAALRANPPPALGDLGLEETIQSIEGVVAGLGEKPILIGHSVGGLIAQVLANRGLAEMAVCISSVAPNRLLSFDWGFIKNAALINNPLKGNEPFYTDLEAFHAAFCNTMSTEETKAAFEQTATHDSRNVLRDCLGSSGEVDLEEQHVPLLFIGGGDDAIIPSDLVRKNAGAYGNSRGAVDLRIFPGRGHFICGQPGWQAVADYVAKWIRQQSPAISSDRG
jgi:pimeloyl-ACP methyl ester carboxylesterase